MATTNNARRGRDSVSPTNTVNHHVQSWQVSLDNFGTKNFAKQILFSRYLDQFQSVGTFNRVTKNMSRGDRFTIKITWNILT